MYICVMENNRVKKPRKAKERILGNNILELMDKKGMIAKELSDLSGLSPSFISRIIHNQRMCISLPVALKISLALKEPVEKVFSYQRVYAAKK